MIIKTFFSLVFIFVVSIAQYLFDFSIQLQLFYTLSVIYITWQNGIWFGISLSFISSLSSLITYYLLKHDIISMVPYINTAFNFIGLLIVTYITAEFKRANNKHKEMSRIDPLTSLYNKRGFYDLSAMEISKIRRFKNELSLLCMDLDNFKIVNDSYGHLIGDKLLTTVAHNIKNNVREVDLVGRLGGDEFAVLLTGADSESAFLVANKLQKILSEIMKEKGWPVTFSIGAATFSNPPDDVEDMINKADILMYTAKKNGKNLIRQLVYN